MAPRCKGCQTTSKIDEVAPGVFLCHGYCRKDYNLEMIRKDKEAAAAAASLSASSANAPTAVANGNGSGRGTQWRVGDFCRALWNHDNVVYEASIQTIAETEDGKQYSVVKFLGYGNEESVFNKDLKPSLGSASRAKQEAEARGDATATAAEEPKGEPSKPKAWAVGDHCRAVYTADGIEYEAEIKEVAADEKGQKYASVVYVGYLNEEVQWFVDLLPSQGEDARRQQEREAKGEQPEPEPEKAEAAKPEPESVKTELAKQEPVRPDPEPPKPEPEPVRNPFPLPDPEPRKVPQASATNHVVQGREAKGKQPEPEPPEPAKPARSVPNPLPLTKPEPKEPQASATNHVVDDSGSSNGPTASEEYKMLHEAVEELVKENKVGVQTISFGCKEGTTENVSWVLLALISLPNLSPGYTY